MHRYLDHTADLRAELVAPDFAALLDEAVALVRELLVGDSPVAARTERRFALAGEDEAEQLFRFVRELVYLADSESFLPAAVGVEARAVRVAGERFDPARHGLERQVKAVTRHGLLCERVADGWRAELVFDL